MVTSSQCTNPWFRKVALLYLFRKPQSWGWLWWLPPIISAFRKLRWGVQTFKASLHNTSKPCLRAGLYECFGGGVGWGGWLSFSLWSLNYKHTTKEQTHLGPFLPIYFSVYFKRVWHQPRNAGLLVWEGFWLEATFHNKWRKIPKRSLEIIFAPLKMP